MGLKAISKNVKIRAATVMERSKTTFIIFDGQFLEMPLNNE